MLRDKEFLNSCGPRIPDAGVVAIHCVKENVGGSADDENRVLVGFVGGTESVPRTIERVAKTLKISLGVSSVREVEAAFGEDELGVCRHVAAAMTI